MIDKILMIMEQIAESLFNALNALADFGKYLAVCFVYMFLILTVPFWIVPIRIWKRRRNR